MSSDITLSAAVRSTLLSLISTTNLIERTQNRLSTGLKVASAIDDPVAFFQAKTLTDRAFDFTEKKEGIDQGITSLTSALEGAAAIEDLVRQLKGLANSLKAATGSQFSDIVSQYNNIRTQIGTLADDTTYQGVNLINSTSETLSVSFSEQSGSLLTVNSFNLRESGLLIEDANIIGEGGPTAWSYSADTEFEFTPAGSATVVLTYQGSQATFSAGVVTIDYGTLTLDLSISVGTNQAGVAATKTISAGDIITVRLGSSVNIADNNSQFGIESTINTAFIAVVQDVSALDISADQTVFLQSGETAEIDRVIVILDSALTTLRSNAQTIGSNVALLQTRLDFTEVYVNELEAGGSKLTLADINEEGANLLALQTRQQLGISALAFAGQAEQGILALFR